MLATDDIGGTHYQIIKQAFGPLDTATLVTATVGLPVGDAGGSLTVDSPQLPAALVGARLDVNIGASAATVTVDSELAAAAALADAAANPTVPSVGALALLFNGTTWDRMPGTIANGLDVDVTRLPALVAGSANIGDVDVLTVPADPFGANADAASATGSISAKLRHLAATGIAGLTSLPAGTNNIGDVDVLSIAAGTALIGDVGLGVRTSGGATLFKDIDVDETEDAIKATAGQLYWLYLFNATAAIIYVRLYNATVANVVVGTTVPDMTIPVPGNNDTDGAGVSFTVVQGIVFSTALTIAATTGVADNDTGAPAANALIACGAFA